MMSQTAFLEDVVSWDERKCLDQVDEALPRLITCLQAADAVEEQIGVLRIICHSFLPCVKQHEVERNVFSKISEKTCDSFDKLLDGLQMGNPDEGHPQTAEGITSSLEVAVEVVDCIESCIRNLIDRKQQLEVNHLHSLPGCTIHLLSRSYKHCHDSADLYKDLLGMVSEPLSALFRKAHSLQMAFLNLLEQTTVCGEATEQDVQDLCQVCTGLYNVCQIVTALDIKVVVSLWKAISKVASQYKDILHGHLDVCQMVCYLCQEIVDAYRYLFQLVPCTDKEGMVQSQGDEKAFLKSLKILAFQMKILVVLVKDFRDFLGQCEKELLSLMITVYKCLPPSLSSSKLQSRHLDQIRTQIVVAIDPLLTSLLGNRHFRQCVTLQDSGFSEDENLPLLLLQIHILEMLPKLPGEEQDSWICPTVHPEDPTVDNLLQAVFVTAGKCCVEFALPVYLPGVIVPGKQQRDESLYGYTCTHLCGFIGSFPARHFAVLEEVLVTNCLSDNPFQSMLAVDCWCFLARYGSAELCFQHIKLLMSMYQDLTTLAVGRLRTTLCRLLKFLAPQHQQTLLKEYIPSENLPLWSVMPIHTLTSNCARDVIDQLVTYCTKTLHNWIGSSEKRLFQLDSVIMSLQCLSNIYICPSLVEKFVTPHQQSVIIEKLSQMWKLFTSSDWDVRPVLELLICRMYQISGPLVVYFHTEDILQILRVTQRLLSQPSAVLLRLEVVSFLQHCGSAKLAPSFEQSQALQKLPELFSQVLKDGHCVVQHKALEAFARFAENTVHESVVPECMERDASLQDSVVAYLNKVPSRPTEGILSPVDYLKEQVHVLESPVVYSAQSVETSHLEPASKRPRTENDGRGSEESHHHALLQRLQSVCSDVQTLLTSSTQPVWFVSSIQQTLTNLSQCLHQNTV